MYRIGYSKDIHRLVEGRKLILGGVVIPFEKGELAHSDGDVLFHAIAESIYGALAEGDLGKHFPDTSNDTLNMDSSIIVTHAVNLAKDKGYHILNLDCTVVLEKPKLAKFIEEIKKNIAGLLNVDCSRVSIKACTNEGIGELGRNEAIEATAIVMLERD